MKSISYIVGLLLFSTASLFAQDCYDYHEHADCNMERQRGYKIYSQSKSASISTRDTLEFNIVFYGQKDYIFSFCTRPEFFPIHFCMIDPGSGEILYDNANDRYLESLDVGFDIARSIAIKINVLGNNILSEEPDGDIGCIGLLIQYKDYPRIR